MIKYKRDDINIAIKQQIKYDNKNCKIELNKNSKI